MRYSIRTVTPLDDVPTVITLDQAKAHLQVDFDDDDLLIGALLRSAQDHVEQHTGQVLTVREMEMALAGFPMSNASSSMLDAIELPRSPVTEISAIAYTDGDGESVDLVGADWRWSESEPNLVLPAYGTSWPTAYDERGSVRVAFQAGYEEGLAPSSLEAAVKLMLGHLYANREGVIVGSTVAEMPIGVEALCAPYRRVGL